jgi:branched-chain amino acid transport system ATP-binding protein
MSALLRVEEVVRSFGGIRAVDGASLAVEPGSITGLIGPNGAGKSTLFNCVSGFLRPHSGRVLLDGRRIDRRGAHRIARAGLVRTFQTPRALTRMTVLENVLLAAPNHPGERLRSLAGGRARERQARSRAGELLALVRLDAHAHALAGTLSGGQRKLLDLVRALMAEPRILLLDEPMAGVAPALRGDLLAHILELRDRDGITLLIVEHDLDFVMRACDGVIVMSDGRVIAEGAPDAVRRDERVIDAYLGAHGGTGVGSTEPAESEAPGSAGAGSGD